MNHPALPEPERQLGKYHIVRPLKVGGTAAIYLAVLRGENNFSREVVIKRPLPHLVADNRARLMFVDEAHIASRLSHPNICQVLDLVAREDELYLVLEYLKGVDLREVLKRCMELGRLMPPEVAVWIAIEVCAGLDFAHDSVAIDGTALNVIHRDVSPKNIRITHSGSVKVIDFGIARAASRATETAAGTIKGTLGYMSPEQIMGDDIDRRSDIFAFGICLFQMLTCRNPFDGATLKERVRRLTQAPVPSVREFNGALDPEIEAIVHKCLMRDVEERYQRMRDVQIDLDRYLAKLQGSSPRQKLISFLEDIFPGVHDTDHELKVALTEISSVTGRIDTSQRLLFPDDEGARPASMTTRSTIRGDGTSSTLKDEAFQNTKTAAGNTSSTQTGVGGSETAKLPPLETAVDERRARSASGSQDATTALATPVGFRNLTFILAAVVGLVAVLVYFVIDKQNRVIDEPSTTAALQAGANTAANGTNAANTANTAANGTNAANAANTAANGTNAANTATATLAVSPPPDRTIEPLHQDATKVEPGKGKDRHVNTKVANPNPREPDLDRARLLFKTALRLEREGKTDDALLLYTLAYDRSGKRVDAAIFKNLGLLHNRENDAAKARACLRGYLDKNPSADDAERIRMMIASYPPTKTVPCVEGAEISHARRLAERRGAVIESWVNATIEERLR